VSVRDSSIEAYHQLKSEGKISEKRSIAFNALKEYAEAEGSDRWPTKVELYEWAQGHLDNEEFPFSRFGNFKPRITELTPDSDATEVELVEYLDEKREQDSDTTDRSAHPVKILSYQSTLSSESGEAAELRDEDSGSDSEQVSDSSVDSEIEIPYEVDDGSEVKMGSPSQAIEETDDLDSVVEMLEAKDLLDKYEDEIEAVRSDESGVECEQSDEEDGGSDYDEESRDVVNTDMDYVFDPDDDYRVKEEDELVSDNAGDGAKDSVSTSDEAKEEDQSDAEEEADDEEEQQVLMKDGEVVV
jgi:hypothetical protein